MSIFTLTRASAGAKHLDMKQVLILPIAAIAVTVAGCVQVSAPDKPIEINLNINVKQEVIVRLQKDAQDLIDNNPELFPK